MALPWQVVLLLLHCVLFIKSESTVNYPSDITFNYQPTIWSILDYLNAAPDRIYNYNFGYILNAQRKTDEVVDLELQVDAECINQDVCSSVVLTCRGYVEYFSDSNRYEALPGVNCQPKVDYTTNSYVPQVYAKVAENEETTQTNIEEVVEKKNILCTGCGVELDKNVEGLEPLINDALRHIESERQNKHVLLEILSVKRQLVAGVKYTIVMKVAPTVCSKSFEYVDSCPLDLQILPEICKIQYIQKPWINKDKHIISNNCTLTQEYIPINNEDKKDLDNEIDINNGYNKQKQYQPQKHEGPNFDSMAETDNLEVTTLTEDRLADLISQILPTDTSKEHKAKLETTKAVVDTPQLGVEDIPSIQTSTNSFVHDNADVSNADGVDAINVHRQKRSESEEHVKKVVNKKTGRRRVSSPDEDKDLKEEALHAAFGLHMRELSRATRSQSSEESEEKKKKQEQELSRAKRDDSQSSEESEENKKKQGQELSTTKRDDSQSSEESKEKKKKQEQELSRAKRDDSQSSEESEENKERLGQELSRTKRDVSQSSQSSEESEEKKKKQDDNDAGTRKKRDKSESSQESSEEKTDLLENKPAVTTERKRRSANSSEESNSNESSNEHNDKPIKPSPVDRKTRSIADSDYSASDLTNDFIFTINENNDDFDIDHVFHNKQDKLRKKRNTNNDSSSSSSSSSDDNDNNNNNDGNNNNQDSKKHRSNRNENNKHDKNYKNDKKGDDDSSSSSSSSSSDDDNGKNGNNGNNNRNRRDLKNVQKSKSDENVFVKKLANFAASSFDDKSHKNEVIDILKVKKIDLEGTVYHLSMRVSESQCEESTGICIPKKDKLCKVQSHVSKSQKIKILKSRCHDIERESDKNRTDKRFKRQVPGGITDSKDNDLIRKLLKTTLLQLDGESPHPNKYKILEIIEAKQQVVAGKLYRIKAKIILSDCLKDNKKDTDLCEELKESTPKICNIHIWDRPWLTNGKVTNVTCDSEAHTFRSRRSAYQHLLGEDEHDYHLNLFKTFIKKFEKTYPTSEETIKRFKIFRANMIVIKSLNSNELGTAVYGITKFSDLTKGEFKRSLGYRPDLHSENDIKFPDAVIPNIELPTEFDWRKNGVVSEVKDQGQCGSCWAFSVTGNIEGQYALKHNDLLEFSEQELVDCDKLDEGCNGGLMDNAYKTLEEIGGLELEKDYPYDARNEKCHFNKTMSRVQVSGAVNISHDESDMARWLVKNGPISIAINANAMQFYMGGVSHPMKFLCDPNDLDHGVLIVGYGVHKYPLFNKTLPYWIIKNSWGTSWGEQGYYRAFRGDGTCGLNQTPSSAVVE